MKIVIAMTGASGAHLGLKIAQALEPSVEKYLIATPHALRVIEAEKLPAHTTILDNDDIGASIASGSFGVDAMIIAPCSMNTLAKIRIGIADNLVTRAASVVIKEQKKLLIAPREIPFSPIALQNMLFLSKIGVIIAPPVVGYYSGQTTLDEMETFFIGKWFDLLGIDNTLYQRWNG